MFLFKQQQLVINEWHQQPDIILSYFVVDGVTVLKPGYNWKPPNLDTVVCY